MAILPLAGEGSRGMGDKGDRMHGCLRDCTENSGRNGRESGQYERIIEYKRGLSVRLELIVRDVELRKTREKWKGNYHVTFSR